MIVWVLLIMGAFLISNGIFLTIQSKKISDTVAELRKYGDVAYGSEKGILFLTKVIVVLAVDQNHKVKTAKRISKLNLFQRGEIDTLSLRNQSIYRLKNTSYDYSTQKALEAAVNDYINR